MKQLNFHNHLTWNHIFGNAEVIALAVNDTAQMSTAQTFVHIYPLVNDTSSLGIQPNSIVVTEHNNPAKPPIWDAVAKRITYWPPAVVAGGTHLIKYKWKDIAGNESNEASVNVSVVTAGVLSWRPLASSFACIVGADAKNTGYSNYATLEQIETYPNGTVKATGITKANAPNDPDYIPDAYTPVSCPVPVDNAPVQLYFYVSGFGLAISSFRLGSTGQTAFINHTSAEGVEQPLQINVAPGTYDKLIVEVEVMTDQAAGVGELQFTALGGSGTFTYTVQTGVYTIEIPNVEIDINGGTVELT